MKREYVNFTTIREDFSEYEAENGQILKAKQIVVDILNEVKEDGTKSSSIGFRDVSSVITTVEIDTSNLQYMPHEQVTEKDVVKELNFKILKEVINVYETNKSIIIVSPQLQKLFLTNKKDNKNNPILRYIMKSGVNILSKSMLAGNEMPENQEK